jgi:malonate-semialdehyde dehydrogenase (acetylating)/methylmalonate-semialdehyde dehydrogenase
MRYDVQHFINGKHVSVQGRKLDIYNPAIGEVVGNVSVADKQLVNQAVSAAQSAYASWSAKPASQRAKILFNYKTILDAHIKELAELVTREHGKTLLEAAGSVQRGIDVLEFACGIPFHLKGSFSEEVATAIDCYSMHQPLGVCVGITPFNFPAMIALWMFPIAIACGNTFILKPSEKDPSCGLRLVELAKEAGVPDGVINVVHGDKETVDALITHPAVDGVSFVGSSTVAEYIHRTASAHHKRVQAFGGAKNHCMVMPDADLDVACDAITMSAYGSAGERCMAISAVVAVGDKVADDLIAKMRPKIQAIKIGPGTQPKIDMGPLVTKDHYEKVKSYIDLGQTEGAKLIIDGSQYHQTDAPQGYYLGCSLFDHVTKEMKIYQDEIFGPVLVVVRVPDFDAGLQLINDHVYGNGTAIFTRDGYTARMFVEKVKAGMVGVNVPVPVPVPYHSFGGWKRSIFSDIGMYGSDAVKFYTRLKTVTQRWYARK